MPRECENSTDEIEITSAMIEAGKLALVTHDPEHFSMDEIVASIWRSMSQARPKEERHLNCPNLHLEDN